jgi:hypothetical protein
MHPAPTLIPKAPRKKESKYDTSDPTLYKLCIARKDPLKKA